MRRKDALLRRSACAALFWSKVFLAVLMALGGLALQGYLVYDAHRYNSKNTRIPPTSIQIRIPSAYDNNASLCFYSNAPPGNRRSIPPLARLEPPGESFLFGFHLQWDVDQPEQIVKRLNGRKPPIINAFTHINNTDFQLDMINWKAQQAGKEGAILELTLMPSVNVETISNDQLYAFAVLMRRINSVYGTPVLLRYMHEMNGNWMVYYGMRPKEMISSFQTLARYVHRLTNLTAMVWSPNIAYGYPYIASGFDDLNPRPNHPDPIRAENFEALDTNNDGRLTDTDDAYSPYYPGDEFVDWVGVSVYNTGRDSRTRQTTPANPNIVAAYISSASDTLFDFYGRYSAAKGKPFMLSETGSAFITNYTSGDELSIKQSWWVSILNAAVRSNDFPNWKAAVWFEEIKPEQSYDDSSLSVIKDYRITFKEDIKNALVRDLTAEPRLVWADSMKYSCNGSVSVSSSRR